MKLKDLLQKLKESYNQLSYGQKKVAKVFFEEPNKIAFSPAFEIGKHVDVSESTVIRLTQKLGYKGYAEVQGIVQKDLAKERVLTQYKEVSNISNKQSFLHDLMQGDAENILQLQRTIREEDFLKAVQTISKAKKIYITGNLLSYGLAHFFTQWLNMVLENTQLIIHGDGQYYHQLSMIQPEDVVIALIFPRYMKDTVETVKLSKDLGASVISITDSELSPVCVHSDIVLKVPINSSINIDSYTAVLSLITSIMRFVSVQDPIQVENKLKRIESIYHKTGVFYNEK